MVRTTHRKFLALSKRRSKRSQTSRRSDYNVPQEIFNQRPDCHLVPHPSNPHYIVVRGELVPCKVTVA